MALGRTGFQYGRAFNERAFNTERAFNVENSQKKCYNIF